MKIWPGGLLYCRIFAVFVVCVTVLESRSRGIKVNLDPNGGNWQVPNKLCGWEHSCCLVWCLMKRRGIKELLYSILLIVHCLGGFQSTAPPVIDRSTGHRSMIPQSRVEWDGEGNVLINTYNANDWQIDSPCKQSQSSFSRMITFGMEFHHPMQPARSAMTWHAERLMSSGDVRACSVINGEREWSCARRRGGDQEEERSDCSFHCKYSNSNTWSLRVTRSVSPDVTTITPRCFIRCFIRQRRRMCCWCVEWKKNLTKFQARGNCIRWKYCWDLRSSSVTDRGEDFSAEEGQASGECWPWWPRQVNSEASRRYVRVCVRGLWIHEWTHRSRCDDFTHSNALQVILIIWEISYLIDEEEAVEFYSDLCSC